MQIIKSNDLINRRKPEKKSIFNAFNRKSKPLDLGQEFVYTKSFIQSVIATIDKDLNSNRADVSLALYENFSKNQELFDKFMEMQTEFNGTGGLSDEEF